MVKNVSGGLGESSRNKRVAVNIWTFWISHKNKRCSDLKSVIRIQKPQQPNQPLIKEVINSGFLTLFPRQISYFIQIVIIFMWFLKSNLDRFTDKTLHICISSKGDIKFAVFYERPLFNGKYLNALLCTRRH